MKIKEDQFIQSSSAKIQFSLIENEVVRVFGGALVVDFWKSADSSGIYSTIYHSMVLDRFTVLLPQAKWIDIKRFDDQWRLECSRGLPLYFLLFDATLDKETKQCLAPLLTALEKLPPPV